VSLQGDRWRRYDTTFEFNYAFELLSPQVFHAEKTGRTSFFNRVGRQISASSAMIPSSWVRDGNLNVK
jgi:hypothetical protein